MSDAQGSGQEPVENDDVELVDAGHVARTEAVEATLKRSPKYGTFLGLGAVLGSVAAWIWTTSMPPVEGQDTVPVIGLMIVAGFVGGGLLGAIAALVADRFLGRKTVVVQAEHTVVERVESDDEAEASQEDSAESASSERREP